MFSCDFIFNCNCLILPPSRNRFVFDFHKIPKILRIFFISNIAAGWQDSGFLLASKTRLNEVSIGVSKTSAKVTPFQSIFRSIQHQESGVSPTFVIFEMVRFSTPPCPPPHLLFQVSFFLSFSVTGKSYSDKERNVVHKG